jgi:hypothetical protein
MTNIRSIWSPWLGDAARVVTEVEQGCQIFLGPHYQNGGKRYQMDTKYQMAVKNTKWP